MTNFSLTPAADLRVVPFTFEQTEVTVEPVSPAGRAAMVQAFGQGVASVNLPKSRLPELEAFLAARGLVLA